MNRSGYSLVALYLAVAWPVTSVGCFRLSGDAPVDAGEPAPGTPCDGYTLFTMGSPQAAAGQGAALVDMEGRIVTQWAIPGFPAVMLPGGALLGTRGNYADTLATNEVVQVGWEGEQQWSFSGWYEDGNGETSARQHHDYQREGNPVGYYAPGQQAVQQGNTIVLAHTDRVATEIYPGQLLDDVIYEVDWQDNPTDFEWHAADHFDEMGLPDAVRELLRDARPLAGRLDWLHINSIARLGENRWYDEGDERFHPDNIIFSARNTDTVAIISRLSGDIVWRVGPDYSEGRPEHGLGPIIGQHHAHMIPRGLPGEGNILLFDNGGQSVFGYDGDPIVSANQRGYSRVVEFDPVELTVVWQYGKQSGPQQMLSLVIGSAQRLPNGNTLITIGVDGRIIEVTPDNQIVWEYASPLVGVLGNSSVYRAYRIPPEWLPPAKDRGGYRSWAELYGS